MSRRLFVATTVAVVCSVGRLTLAGQVGSDRSDSDAPRYRVSSEVTQFLSPDSDFGMRYVALMYPVQFDLLPDVVADLRPPLYPHVTIAPPTPALSTDYPLVPLPPPLWTGTAGLLGLGLVAFCRKLRKDSL